MPHASTPDPGRSLAANVFAGLFKDWTLLTLGCVHIATPRGTPVITGESLSEIVGRISGAAVRAGYCPNGTGWPAGASR